MAFSAYDNAEELTGFEEHCRDTEGSVDGEWYSMMMEAERERQLDSEYYDDLFYELAPEPTECRNPWWGTCQDACLDEPDNIPF
jgi:hypothetical protein